MSYSVGKVAGLGSGWLALLAFLAAMQLQTRWSARRRDQDPL